MAHAFGNSGSNGFKLFCDFLNTWWDYHHHRMEADSLLKGEKNCLYSNVSSIHADLCADFNYCTV